MGIAKLDSGRVKALTIAAAAWTVLLASGCATAPPPGEPLSGGRGATAPVGSGATLDSDLTHWLNTSLEAWNNSELIDFEYAYSRACWRALHVAPTPEQAKTFRRLDSSLAGLDAIRAAEELEPYRLLVRPWWSPEDLAREEVMEWRERFLAHGARSVRHWVDRAAPYHDDVMRVMQGELVPEELWVLTLVESGFRLDARSRANAVGPWQFVPRTARHCGLALTVDRDERRDWEAATRAACHYLLELYEEFGDGLLAMAAFNCGPGRVRREIREHDSTDFWELSLPRETRRYVPRMLALVSILETDDRHTFAIAEDAATRYDAVSLPYTVKVEDLASVVEVDAEALMGLNPSWLQPTTPEDGHPVLARVPTGTGAALVAALDAGTLPKSAPIRYRVHKVKTGDTLWDISRKYRVRLDSLLAENGMSGKEVLRPGKLLKVPPS